MRHHLRHLLGVTGILVAVLMALAATPDAQAMRSTKIAPGVCKTVGGGKFVGIPGFPGERIDRRLLRDIRWMRRAYDIFITDGYSTAPYHAPNGEHPIGLALDIVPHKARGGTWAKITRLAKLAEPKQNRPRAPWRWVGYNGDAGHGRGHHLHLSYLHSDTKPRRPARIVYTHRCPQPPEKPTEPSAKPAPKKTPRKPRSGGVAAPRTSAAAVTSASTRELAPVVAETAGADLADAR